MKKLTNNPLFGHTWKRLLWLSAIAVLVLLPAACQSSSEPESVTVGIYDAVNIGTPVAGFQEGMAELGYTEGENITYVMADAPQGFSPDAMLAPATALVEAEVDLILCVTTPACTSAKAATAETETPVLFLAVSDPVAVGLVEDFVDPGGHVTGVTSAAPDSANEGQRLEWLATIAPDVETVYLPYNPDDPTSLAKLAAISDAADKLGLELVLAENRSPEEATALVENFPSDVDALFTMSERSLDVPSLQGLAAQAQAHNMPYSAPGVEYGALLAYAPDLHDMGRQVARMADQILQGTAVTETPVETPEFFLTINMPVAEAIGLEIPDEILRQADTVLR